MRRCLSPKDEKGTTQTVKHATDPSVELDYWWLLQQWRLCCFFFFFLLLLIRLSSTRTRSTLAPFPPTLSVTWQRRSCRSTRTRWRGNKEAMKVCLTVSTTGTEPDLGLGFICLVLFSLFVVLSCPAGFSVIGRVTLCCIPEEFFPIFRFALKKMQPRLSFVSCSSSLFIYISLAPSCGHQFWWRWPCVLNQVFFRANGIWIWWLDWLDTLYPKSLNQGQLSFLNSNIIYYFIFF